MRRFGIVLLLFLIFICVAIMTACQSYIQENSNESSLSGAADVSKDGENSDYETSSYAEVSKENGDLPESGCAFERAPTFANGDDAYIITGKGSFDGAELVIPAQIDGIPVVAIGERAFLNCSEIKSLIIPDSVTSIGQRAFDGCSSLENIIFGSGVETIGNSAFNGCSSLVSVELPYSLKVLEKNTFSSCPSLVEVRSGPCLTTVEREIFTSVFSGSSLQYVYLPASLSSIDPKAFVPPSDLKHPLNIILDEANPYFTVVDSVFFSKDMTKLCVCTSKSGNYTVPDGVKLIGESAFEYSSLSDIYLPDSVTYISKNAFSQSVMRFSFSLHIEKSLKYIAEYAFATHDGMVTIFFNGTKAEWSDIKKAPNWDSSYSSFESNRIVVHCTDGDLTY